MSNKKILVRNNNEIYAYNIVPKTEEIKNYREQEFAMLEKRNVLYQVSTNDNETINNFAFYVPFRSLGEKQLNFVKEMGNGESRWSYFELMERGKDRNELIEKIIDDKMNGFPLRRVYNELTGELLYNLLITKQSSYAGFDSIHRIEDIISLPTNLFYLQYMLQEGRFEELAGCDIKKQLQLFDYELEDFKSIEEFEKFLKYEVITKDELYDLYKRADNGAKVMQMIRKK